MCLQTSISSPTQPSLYPAPLQPGAEALALPDGEVILYEAFFTPAESEQLFTQLLATTQWAQSHLKIYGKEIAEPRLTAWYGDAGKSYTYSGITRQPLAWTPALSQIKERVESVAQSTFNSVLLNLYRDGRDSIGWHQDNEPELGQNPVIASVSFGATRRFRLRHKRRKDLPLVELDLTQGSLLIMRGTTQHFWQHQIPKTAELVGPRINLTFRMIF
jgi:alkylated DNA repair dioxygenase AlkB